MASNNVLRWLDGRGWLVFSGDDASDVRAQAIGQAAADGGVAYVTLGGKIGLGEQALADMQDLGAPSGYLVDVMTEDDQTIETKLAEAGMIVIENVGSTDDLRSSLIGAAATGIQTAFQNGAVILAEGTSAMTFGAWVLLESGGLVSGLEWLESALIMPGLTSVAQSSQAQMVLYNQPDAILIGIGAGSALALGPDGKVETWGKRQVTITLGRAYGTTPL